MSYLNTIVLVQMVKMDAIRVKDRALCDRAVMERWLYGNPRDDTTTGLPTTTSLHHSCLAVVDLDHSCLAVVDLDHGPANQECGPAGLERAQAATEAKSTTAELTPIQNPMQNVIVLETQPFNMSNKENNARDKAVWNQLWDLVR